MKDQMELFEDGGLKDEGGMIDEESGNEVPIGGTKKGVRDDVPAMVSEGEFVFPEDVTRYIGLDKLMQMRQKAKMGLKRMEAMGQMGNGDEATMPDDMPFGAADLVIVAGEPDKDLKMQEGGVVQTAAPRQLTQPIEQPTRPAVDFKTLMGQAYVEFKTYRNEQGATLLIPFVGGNAVYPIPSGYSLYEPSTEIGEEPSTPETTVAAEVTETINRATGKDKDDKGNYTVPPSEFQKAGGWSMDTSGKDGKDLQIWIDEANKFVNGTSTVVTGISAAFGLGLPVAYFTARDKKQILKDIDSKIAQARKTDMAGQVAALENIKKGLEEKTTGLGSAIDSITGKIGDLFNLTSTQKEEATNFASKIQSIEDTPAPVSEPTVTQEGGFGTPLVDELIPKPKPIPTPDEGFQQDQASQTLAAFTPTVSGPAAAEAQFGAPLGDPLGGTPPAVDELVFTPSLPVPPVSGYDEIKADPRLLESAGVPFQYPAPTPVTTPAPQPTTPVGASSFDEALTQQAPSLIAEDIQQTDAYKLRYGDTDYQMQSLMPPVVPPSAPVVTGYDDAPLFTTPSTPTPAPSYATRDMGEAGRTTAPTPSTVFDTFVTADGTVTRDEVEQAQAAADKAAREKAEKEEAEREASIAAGAKAAADKAPAEKAAKEKAEKEEAAREAAIAAAAKRDRDDDTNSIFNKTLETTGTATRTGSAAPSTSIRPTARPTTSSSDDSSSDSSCVIATHGVATGGFSFLDKAKAELWCEKTYHNKWYGEAFRRGYRYAGNTAIKKGNAAKHYQEFKDFVLYGRGLKKDWKSAVNYYKRTIQFFVTGLIVR